MWLESPTKAWAWHRHRHRHRHGHGHRHGHRHGHGHRIAARVCCVFALPAPHLPGCSGRNFSTRRTCFSCNCPRPADLASIGEKVNIPHLRPLPTYLPKSPVRPGCHCHSQHMQYIHQRQAYNIPSKVEVQAGRPMKDRVVFLPTHAAPRLAKLNWCQFEPMSISRQPTSVGPR